MKESIHVMIVEDELLVAEDIRIRLEKHDLQVTGLYASGEEALENLAKDAPDLVLMDIHLAGKLDGILTAELIRRSSKIPVIYLSELSDPGTLKRAVKTMPENYLTKPFNEADLVRAIDLAFYNARHRQGLSPSKESDDIFVRTENQVYIKLKVDDILFLRADRAYCHVVCVNKTYTLSNSMNHVAGQIDSAQLVKVHRSFMVNLNHVSGIDGNVIRLGDHQIQMSKDMRDEVVGRLRLIR
jgi:DNA-binding LytR/AlgR family response regulator